MALTLNVEQWGLYDGKPCNKFVITDTSSGGSVTVTELGAALLRIVRPDKNGKLVDIALTQETPEELIQCKGHLGATVGRYANRIGYGRFELYGTEHKLFCNNGPHTLHGGKDGFTKKMWQVIDQYQGGNEVRISFKYESPDGEEGFPGTLTSTITYHFEPNKIWWVIEATTDRPTVVNLTNHTYWNLEGLGVTIDDQSIEIGAKTYFPVDENAFPTGEVREVEKTLDMRSQRKFGDVFKQYGEVDNNFFLDQAGQDINTREVHYCARASSSKTGIAMTIHTSEPCVQLYTGNFIHELVKYNGNYKAEKHHAFCLETQRPPDAPNNPAYKDMVTLIPEQAYVHKTVHEFSYLP